MLVVLHLLTLLLFLSKGKLAHLFLHFHMSLQLVLRLFRLFLFGVENGVLDLGLLSFPRLSHMLYPSLIIKHSSLLRRQVVTLLPLPIIVHFLHLHHLLGPLLSLFNFLPRSHFLLF